MPTETPAHTPGRIAFNEVMGCGDSDDFDFQSPAAQQAWERAVKLAAAHLAPAAQPAWIPVSERLPEHETDVLVRVQFGSSARLEVAGLYGAFAGAQPDWYSFEQPERELRTVTHWMPLPPAPSSGQEQGERT